MAVVTQTMQDNVTELYIGFFGRAPDAAGFGYWTNRLAVGDVTIQQISKAFAATPEFVSNYSGLTPTQQVQKVYQNVLNRAADTAGLAYWVGQLTTGTQTIADVVWNVTNSAFIQQGTADGLLVQNKVTVGEYFAITLASNDTASAATAYNLVTSNPASVAQAEATLVSATYTLTTSIDNITMKSNAVVNGIIDFAGGTAPGAATTMNSSDTITGTGVNDSLKVTLQNASGAVGASSAAVAQVNKITVPTVTADVAQVNQYTFGTAASSTKTYTYGGSNGSFAFGTTDTSNATSFANSLNLVAGSTVATVGSAVSITITAAATTLSLANADAAKLVAGMSVSSNGTGAASGVYIKSIGAPGASETVVTLSSAFGGSASGSTATFGGGTASVTVKAPVAGTASPSLSFTDASIVTASSLVRPNVSGNEGDVVTFTYNGLTGSYVIGASIDATATNLKDALTATIPTSQAVAAVVDNGTSDYVTLTAATAGTALSNLVFSGSAGDIPTVTINQANVPATGGISFGNNSGLTALYANNITGYGATIDQNSVSGAAQLWSDRSSGAVTFTNVGKTTTVGINGNGTSTALGALTATYVAGTTAANVAINGGATAGAVTINANADGQQKTVNVASTSGAQASTAGQVNTVASLAVDTSVTALNINAATSLTATNGISGTNLATINATGAATTVDLGTLADSVKTVNASGLTAGGVKTTLTANTTSFVGGAGVDTVTTAATTAATALIDGGAGSGDILVLATTNDVTTASKAAQYVNFEVLRNKNTTAGASEVIRNIDMSLFSAYTAVQAESGSHVVGATTYTDGAGFINMNATQAANVTNRADNKGATFALQNATGTTDVLSVTLNNATPTTGATLSADLTGVVVTGFETMNVVSSSGTSSDISVLSFANGGAGQLTALNISGAAPLALNTGGYISKAVAINASDMSFAPTSGNYTFDVQGTVVKGSSVTGSATGANKFATGSTAFAGAAGDYVTYTGGAGKDLFDTTFAVINNTNAGYASLKLNGGSGTDTLKIAADSNNVVATDASFQYLSGFETIEIASHSGTTDITTGGFFNSAFASGVKITDTGTGTTSVPVAINLGTYTGNAEITGTYGSTTSNITLTTGTGADKVTLTADALTSATVAISTGDGIDSIYYEADGATSRATNGTTITAGKAADSIEIKVATAKGELVTIQTAAGDSTIAAYDSLTGVNIKDAATSETGTLFKFTSGTTAVAAGMSATAVAGYTTGELTIAVGNTTDGTAGMVTFAGTKAASLSVADALAAIQVTLTAAGSTAAWVKGTEVYLYNAGATTAASDDSFIQLVGVTATVDFVAITGAGGSIYLDT